MTVKDFFRLLIKLFALYSLVVSLFAVIRSIFGFIPYEFDWLNLAWIAFTTILLFALFVMLAFQTDRIVEKLKLERGFDSTHIHFEKLDSFTIIKIGSIVIGCFLLVQNIPHFIVQLYLALRIRASETLLDGLLGFSRENNIYELSLRSINLLFGYLLLTNSGLISKWLSPREEELE
jgi:hypothetical protein